MGVKSRAKRWHKSIRQIRSQFLGCSLPLLAIPGMGCSAVSPASSEFTASAGSHHKHATAMSQNRTLKCRAATRPITTSTRPRDETRNSLCGPLLELSSSGLSAPGTFSFAWRRKAFLKHQWHWHFLVQQSAPSLLISAVSCRNRSRKCRKGIEFTSGAILTNVHYTHVRRSRRRCTKRNTDHSSAVCQR